MLKRQRSRIGALLIALLSMVTVSLPAPAMASSFHMGTQCESETLQVKLAADDPATYQLKGWLCWEGWLPGKTVQVLMSGFTYGHEYWDFPFQSEKYSYVKEAVGDGYATFNVDRIGIGQSDHPADPLKVTVPAEAFVAYQVVQALRNGEVGQANNKFDKVIGVGHSMGAAIWMIEASTYPDSGGVDGLILANYLHKTNPTTQAALQAARVRAQDDPKFASAGLPEGYFTTRQGFRHLYYNADFADRRVIDTDEQLKQTSTLGEAITISLAQNPVYSGNITVPTLVVMGQKDSLFCDEATEGFSCEDQDAVMAREAALYNPAACMEVYVLPVAGHDTNLHYNAQKWSTEAEKWSNRRVGENNWRAPTDPC